MTGLAFAHGSVADVTSPTSMPVHLLDFSRSAGSASASDSVLRSAIVSAANYYLRLAQGKTPGEMEALIWQNDSVDGVDHGESCAAFASLTLEAGAQATGQESWVTEGTSYPWPLHGWALARVDPNPDSPGIISVLQAAQTNSRWHPLGDGYVPQPGDWVLFSGHVEVVTKYAGGVLYTIGGDSLPNLSVNAHQYDDPLGAQGVAGFVNNGELLSAVRPPASAPQDQASSSDGAPAATADQVHGAQGQPAIPGLVAPAFAAVTSQPAAQSAQAGSGAATSSPQASLEATATIPGSPVISGNFTSAWSAPPSSRYSRSQPEPRVAGAPGTPAQQAFIDEVAAGAVAAQRQYGVPASVTIAQAIDESGWGQSQLAAQDHNLFGIKGTGPAGSVMLPTQEYYNGQWVTISAPFRVYHNVAESIGDHTLLLATGSPYKQAMADRQSPDAFANDLTGVYATDPNYGASLIAIMRMYNLYRYDAAAASAPATAAQTASRPGAAASGAVQTGSADTPAGGQFGQARVPGATGMATAPTGTVVTSASGSAGTGSVAAASGTGAAAGGNGVVVSAGGAGGYGDAEAAGYGAAPGRARIPGIVNGSLTASAKKSQPSNLSVRPASPSGSGPVVKAGPPNPRISTRRYVSQIPTAVTADFVTTAKTPLLRAQPLYQDVASGTGIRWELLAACDWMQCQAQPRYSAVHGEKLGTKNADGTVYRTKSEGLAQAASDLVELAAAVYRIDLGAQIYLSVCELANVFAAFRWGGLLKAHQISAMEFPYSVAGLTPQHLKMRWPDIGDSHAPDKPGTRFRMSFGAVPVVLGLGYPAVA